MDFKSLEQQLSMTDTEPSQLKTSLTWILHPSLLSFELERFYGIRNLRFMIVTKERSNKEKVAHIPKFDGIICNKITSEQFPTISEFDSLLLDILSRIYRAFGVHIGNVRNRTKNIDGEIGIYVLYTVSFINK